MIVASVILVILFVATIIKDVLIYATVFVAILVIPLRLGGYRGFFSKVEPSNATASAGQARRGLRVTWTNGNRKGFNQPIGAVKSRVHRAGRVLRRVLSPALPSA
jgi:hypothetical protein